MKKKPIILSAAVGALLVWVGLLVKGRPVDVDAHLVYRDYLSEQLQQDLILNQTLIASQQTLEPTQETFAQKLQQIQTLQDQLEARPDFLTSQYNQELETILEDTSQLLTQKADLLEQFQAQNLQIKASLSTLALLTQDSQPNNTQAADRQVNPALQATIDQILLYNFSSDEALVEDIERRVTEIDTLTADAERDNIDRFLEHARIILDNKPQVDQLAQSLLSLPTTQQLKTLANTYDEAYHIAERRARLFQLATVIWSLIILATAAYLVLRRRQSYKVEKITNFLSESIDDAFIDVDNHWLITYANGHAANALDKSPDDLTGQLLWTVLPPEMGKDQEHYYQEARNQQALTTFETRFSAKSRWLEFRLSPSVNGLSIFWQDISNRKKAEFQLALSLEANDEALKKAYEAQKKAETERLKAEKANQAKSEFLANMSHELRTPLNAIIGYSEILEEDAEDLAQDGFIPELQKIQSAGKHLLGLINDVLDLSKVEAGHMEMYLETFAVMPLVEDVAATMQPVIEKNNNTLNIQCAASVQTIHADQVKVRQSLFNLLSNASKFTQNGTITISINSENTLKGQWINFRIQDTGIGMLPEQLQKIFNAFAQADSSTTRKYGGTGLGLTITKRFVQMMGGTVNVESDIGKGTTFTVRIPTTVSETVLRSEPPEMPTAEPTSALAHAPDDQQTELSIEQSIFSLVTAPASECILVIDDDDENCKLIWKTLVSQGYFVVLTHNKRKGLKMADQLLPDIILVDSIMLREDGSDNVFDFFEDNVMLSKIPVVVQTKLPDQTTHYSPGKVESSSSQKLQKLLTVLNKYHPNQLEDSVDQNGTDRASRDHHSPSQIKHKNVGVNLAK
ncbi:pas domain s-box [Leptolyngbya sp. Heron Island J]|uniref:DAHL domain-containing protein n=1 Tax=Leptolyngbya sp. Heron Island J TaxID=1385935 RepID=UPI0003B974EC|nr:DAHL domain-containing protein [Leptolyngbya sp. Heron Island J]ESA32169.1 pas domain s-box [Leptolyngbya sp. Heron Island J]